MSKISFILSGAVAALLLSAIPAKADPIVLYSQSPTGTSNPHVGDFSYPDSTPR